jgi:hypothetical protein
MTDFALREQIEERLESAEDHLQKARDFLTQHQPLQALEATSQAEADLAQVKELIPVDDNERRRSDA